MEKRKRNYGIVKYYMAGKWRDGAILSKEEYYKNIRTGLRSAKREWGAKYKYIKLKQNRDGSYRVYGQPKWWE